MSIRTKIEGDFTAINLRGMADDMLADLVADHAQQKFMAGNAANKSLSGEFIPYAVAVNGRTVSQGRGAIMPKAPVATAVQLNAKRRPQVVSIAWAWETLQPSALQRALSAYIRADAAIAGVQNAVSFATAVINARTEAGELFKFLLTKYLERRFPAAAARVGQAAALYRAYRLVKLGQRLIPGKSGGNNAPADADVLVWIASALRDRSPVMSGDYRDAHTLYADQQPLMAASDVTENADLPDAEEFSFTNTLPYSRKIEIGKTKVGRDFVIQVPNRVYERVAQDAQDRFRGIAEIEFEMRAVIGAEQTPQSRARRPHNRPDARYPSIIVRFI